MASGAIAEPTPVRGSAAQRSRLVWLVLAGSSITFLFLCALSIMTVTTFVTSDTAAQSAKIEPLAGARLTVLRRNSVVPELITATSRVSEGDAATTGDDSSAFLQLFDGSTIQTFFSTTLEIETLRVGRYTHNVKEIVVGLRSGTAIMVTADQGGYAKTGYKITTDNAEMALASNSKARVRVESVAGKERTTIVVDYGEALLVANGRTVRVTPGKLAFVSGSEPPAEPVDSAEELIRNGHFTDPPTSGAEAKENGGLGTAGWLPIREQNNIPVNDPGSVTLVSENLPGLGSLNAVKFQRMGRGDHFVKVGIKQEVNRPATFLKSIELFATVRVLRQTTPIGGPQGNLYPLTIRVSYTDSAGTEQEWKQQFYFVEGQLDPADAGQVEQGVWWAPEKNFILKSPDQFRDIAVIRSVEVFGYGSEFQSWITAVSMVAR